MLRAADRLFSKHDLEILTAQSATEALRILQKESIPLLLTNQRLPEMLGTELIDQVHKLSPDTLSIILTGYSDLSSLLEAANTGKIFRFIVRPWKDSKLLKDVGEALEHYQANNRHRKQKEQMLLALAQAIELKDHYTKGHCERVARYATEIAKEMGFPEEQIRDIRDGAWLHDCGKINLHEDILNNPGRVGEHQMLEIKKHPDIGAKMAEQAALPQRVVNIIRFHHERLDGDGYPQGLKGAAIPLEAKIVAVADIYDALTSDRPYRKACRANQVKQIMTGFRGCALETELVDLLMNKVTQGFWAEVDPSE